MITKDFITAGRAIFTLKLSDQYRSAHPECPPHYTYKIAFKEGSNGFSDAWFVNLLTGPDNTSDYTYVGMLNPDNGSIRLTKKSQYKENSPPILLLSRLLLRVWAEEQDQIEKAGFRLHHEGRCGRCGRLLTVPESVESGIGPECASKMEQGV